MVLTGPLGVGKTCFAKGLAAGLGIAPERVTSPTFAIACEYASAHPGAAIRRFAHVDGYRLADGRELEDAGLLDWLVPGTLLAVEWGERFRTALSADRLEIVLSRGPEAAGPVQTGAVQTGEPTGDVGAREIRARATGANAQRALREWRRRLEDDPELDPLDPQAPLGWLEVAGDADA